MYEEVISKSSYNVKVVERAGKSIGQKLQKSYPFKKEKCVISEGFVGTSGRKGNWLRKNVNYATTCRSPSRSSVKDDAQ